MTVSLKKDMRMTSQEKYSRVALWLHWIIAVLVIAGLALGLLHERLENVLPSATPIHKSIGFTVLALTLVRLGWRLGPKPPPLPAEDRKSVVLGKSVSVRVDLGGRSIIKKKKQ